MPVTINKQCICSILFVLITFVIVLQYFLRLFYQQYIVFDLSLATSTLASEVPSYRLLCALAGKNGKSICEESDDEKLAQVISKVYLHRPTGDPYSFQLNPPKLTGQIGVPPIVDKLLGIDSKRAV